MRKTDPLFGLMKFRRTLGIFGAGFWEGEVDFQPVLKSVKIYVTAGRKGVSETQRNFYRELEQRYSGLVEDIRYVIVDTPRKYFGDDFFGNYSMPKLAWDDFELDSIGIPKLNTTRPIQWQLSYRYLPMTDTYSVHFEDWKPVYGELDD